MIHSFVKKMVEETCPCNLELGKRTIHPDGRMVEITKGQYWGTHGVSNFWSWKEVLPNGVLSEVEESGYGW